MRRAEAIRGTEKAIGGFILVLLAGLVATFVLHVRTGRDGPSSESRQPAAAAAPWPEAGLGGWKAPVRVERFDPAELYLKIDGQAEVYLRHHVVRLLFGAYTTNDAARTIDVYWYELATAADARDVYEREKPPSATGLSLGADGYAAGAAVFFVAGASYVQVMPNWLAEAAPAEVLQIAERMAEWVVRDRVSASVPA